ncbi:MAG: DUF4270 family protein [Chitinophagaceae bacterium]
MKQPRFFTFRSLYALLAVVFILSSCKEDAIIKTSLTPSIDNIHTFGIGPDFDNGANDTITIRTHTAFEDTVVTSTRLNGYPIYHAIGAVADPFAGNTTASIYMQIAQPSTTFAFDAADVIDEVDLILPYAGFTWGDTISGPSSQNLSVYAITDPFSKDSTFYNYNRLNFDPTLLGTATLVTGSPGQGVIQDSVLVKGVKKAPHIRIKLAQSYVDALKAAMIYDTSYATFAQKMPGLYITPDSTNPGKALPYVILNGPSTPYGAAGLLVYAHNTVSGNDSIVYQFPYNETYSAHFNRITRNYTGSPAYALLHSTDTNAATLLMQNAPGAAVDLTLPYIQHLPKNVIINKAEIVFTKVSATGDDRFFGPARLLPTGINTTGGRYTLADRYPITSNTLDFMDGTPQQVVKNGVTLTQYRINIPREVQQTIVQGINGIHLRVGGTVNFPAAYRVLLGGTGNPEKQFRPAINIIYTKQ